MIAVWDSMYNYTGSVPDQSNAQPDAATGHSKISKTTFHKPDSPPNPSPPAALPYFTVAWNPSRTLVPLLVCECFANRPQSVIRYSYGSYDIHTATIIPTNGSGGKNGVPFISWLIVAFSGSEHESVAIQTMLTAAANSVSLPFRTATSCSFVEMAAVRQTTTPTTSKPHIIIVVP